MQTPKGFISYFCILISLLFAGNLAAQFYNNGSVVTVGNAGVLHINGDLLNKDSSIYNSGKITVAGNCHVYNKTTSRIVVMNGDTLAVTGNFRDSSLVGQHTGVLVLSGGNQILYSKSEFLANLLLAGSGDKYLSSDFFLRYNLNLKNGHIAVPIGVTFALDSTASISPLAATANSFVVGTLWRERKTGSEDSLYFPIGSTKTELRAATLLGIASASGKFPVFSMSTELSTPQAGTEVTTIYNRIWTYGSTMPAHVVNKLKVYYSSSEVASAPAADLVLAKAATTSKIGVYNSIGSSDFSNSYVIGEFSPSVGHFALGSSIIMKGNFKVLLEGSSVGTGMTNTLRTKLLLQDSVASKLLMKPGYSVPATAVDRIALILQNTGTLAYVDTAYAWLLQDGSVRDYATGTRNYISFTKANSTSTYYVIVQHRNHLAASSNGLMLASSVPSTLSYDYTKGVYGGGALFDAGNNVWKLYASDPYKSWKNQTDVLDWIRTADDNNTGAYRVGTNAYYRYTDLNLDGVVNATDEQVANQHNAKLYYSTLP
jgi:hypothetical protein